MWLPQWPVVRAHTDAILFFQCVFHIVYIMFGNVFPSGGGLQAVLDFSMSGRGLIIHFDTLEPYTG